MKSRRAVPDLVWMSRCTAAMDSSARAMSSVTIAGSVSIVAGGRPDGGPAGASSGSRRKEVTAVEHGLQRVPDERVASSEDCEEAGPARR